MWSYWSLNIYRFAQPWRYSLHHRCWLVRWILSAGPGWDGKRLFMRKTGGLTWVEMFYSSSSFALVLLFILLFWSVCWFTSHSIHSPFSPLLSALLFFTHALVFSFWELRAVLWISNSAGHHGVIDGLWQGPTQSNICSKWKKGNRIKQDSQVAKEKHAKHVFKQSFLGGWGLVHDDTIS